MGYVWLDGPIGTSNNPDYCIVMESGLLNRLTEKIDIWSCISTMTHEMIHFARIDSCFLKNDQEKECQADLLSGLAVRSDDFFLARLCRWITLFDVSELMLYCAAKKDTRALAELIAKPGNECALEACTDGDMDWLILYLKQKGGLTSIIEDGRIDTIVASIRKRTASCSHPPIF